MHPFYDGDGRTSFKDNIWGADLADIQLISNDLMR